MIIIIIIFFFLLHNFAWLGPRCTFGFTSRSRFFFFFGTFPNARKPTIDAIQAYMTKWHLNNYNFCVFRLRSLCVKRFHHKRSSFSRLYKDYELLPHGDRVYNARTRKPNQNMHVPTQTHASTHVWYNKKYYIIHLNYVREKLCTLHALFINTTYFWRHFNDVFIILCTVIIRSPKSWIIILVSI